MILNPESHLKPHYPPSSDSEFPVKLGKPYLIISSQELIKTGATGSDTDSAGPTLPAEPCPKKDHGRHGCTAQNGNWGYFCFGASSQHAWRRGAVLRDYLSCSCCQPQPSLRSLGHQFSSAHHTGRARGCQLEEDTTLE